MLYNIYNKQIAGAKKALLFRKIIAVIILGFILAINSSCTVLTKTMDNSTGLSRHLSQLETAVRKEDWAKAKISLADSKEAWSKIKPVIQIDIDHDYVKNIEDDFVRLEAYLDSQDKSNSLAAILLIRSSWQDIDSL